VYNVSTLSSFTIADATSFTTVSLLPKLCIRVTHTIDVNALVDMLHAVVRSQYNRVQVKLGTCAERAMHVWSCMFRTLDVRTPDGLVVMFRSFHAYAGMSLTHNKLKAVDNSSQSYRASPAA